MEAQPDTDIADDIRAASDAEHIAKSRRKPRADPRTDPHAEHR